MIQADWDAEFERSAEAGAYRTSGPSSFRAIMTGIYGEADGLEV